MKELNMNEIQAVSGGVNEREVNSFLALIIGTFIVAPAVVIGIGAAAYCSVYDCRPSLR